MGRIVEQLRAVGARRAAMLLAVAALAAVLVYVGGRQAGVVERSEAVTAIVQEQPTDATQQGDGEETGADADEEKTGGVEPLTLTLSAPLICETAPRPDGGWTHGLEWHEEEQAWEDIVDEAWWYWDSVGTMKVEWTASGGDGAYTVTISGETHTGPSGIAEVSCAMRHGPITDHPEWGRIHVIENPQWGQFYGEEEKPVVEAGVKTITAAVVDGSGATAEASVDVYAVINRGFGVVRIHTADGVQHDDILQGGTTYRIDGILMTVPEGVDLDVGTSEEYAPGPDDWDDRCCKLWLIGIVGSSAVLSLWYDSYEEESRYVPAYNPAKAIDADRVFDEFLASFGQPPKLGDD